MNIILLSQGSALTIFHQVLPHLKKDLSLNNIGLYLADQRFFDKYSSSNPDLISPEYHYLKEWEIMKDYPNTELDTSLLENLENKYGNTNFWPALISDRRIFLGKNSKYVQDYGPRLSYQDMLKLTQLTTLRIEKFIEQVKPDYILGFNMVTLSEYLFHIIAKQRNIPYAQIKNTKVSNYVTLASTPLTISQEVKEKENRKQSDSVKAIARQYLANAQQKQSTYEGHVILKPPNLNTFLKPELIKKIAQATLFDIIKLFKYSHDQQSNGLAAQWHFNIRKPAQAILQHRYLNNHYIKLSELKNTKYVFFPLHTEPEIALSIFGRFHQNQIEVVRNIAQSIPINWQVVVKDHPRSLGLRSTKYYKKLLDIPNVRLVNPYLTSYDIIEHSQLIAAITSWVGFEAIISKKPVVTFGECTYNALPEIMVTKNTSYQALAEDIKNAIANYQYDEQALLNHIIALISDAYPINLYSEILQKANRHHTKDSKTDPIQKFAHFIAAQIEKQV